jgi:hypothetical protein
MAVACITNDKMRNICEIFVGKAVRGHMGDFQVVERVIIKCTLKK